MITHGNPYFRNTVFEELNKAGIETEMILVGKNKYNNYRTKGENINTLPFSPTRFARG
jgi:hypothetical protein